MKKILIFLGVIVGIVALLFIVNFARYFISEMAYQNSQPGLSNQAGNCEANNTCDTPPEEDTTLRVGDTMPDGELISFNDEVDYLYDYLEDNKWLIIEFTTHDTPEYSEQITIYENLPEEVEFISIYIDDDPELAKLEAELYPWPTYYSIEMRAYYEILTAPVTVVLTSDAIVHSVDTDTPTHEVMKEFLIEQGY